MCSTSLFRYFKALNEHLCIYLGVCATHGAYVEVSGQPVGVSILFAAWGPELKLRL